LSTTYVDFDKTEIKRVCHLLATLKAKGLAVSDLISETLPFGRRLPDRAADSKSDQILWRRSVPGDQLAVAPNKLLTPDFKSKLA
jgi:hypothetical protein